MKLFSLGAIAAQQNRRTSKSSISNFSTSKPCALKPCALKFSTLNSSAVSTNTSYAATNSPTLLSASSFSLSSKYKRLALALSVALPLLSGSSALLSGCQSSVPTGEFIADATFWNGMQERLQSINLVRMTGSVAVIHAGGRFSGQFMFQGQGHNNYQLHLSNSFGVTLAKLNVTPQESTLSTPTQSYTASSPEALFTKVTDLSLPLDNFYELMLGLVPAGYPNASLFNQQGILVSTTINPYYVSYRDYHSLTDLALPKEMEVTGPNTSIIIKVREIQQLERQAK